MITNKRTALTRSLAKMVVRALSRRSNPTDFSDELSEYKGEVLSTLQAEVLGMQVWGKERPAGSQMTLMRMSIHDCAVPTEQSIALCAPGHALIRRFFLDVSMAKQPYQLSWRQQNVPMRIGSIDATFKRGKALGDLKIRQTVWSNDVNAPAIAIMVQSASMEDPAFVAACKDHNLVMEALGMELLSLVYLDAPGRDGPGTGRRFPSVLRGAATVWHDFDMSNATLVTSAPQLPAVLSSAFGPDAADQVYGFDM